MKDRRIPIANIYYLLCYAWSHVDEQDVVRLEELEGLSRVQDLLGKVLAEGTFRLIRRGIDRGYREVREDLAGIRGKIAVGETAKRALRARGQVTCDFEELSHDVLHNRILRSTLGSLLQLPDLHSNVRAEVRNAYTKLDGVGVVRLNRRLFQEVQLDRNRRYYRFLLSVCRLIHEQLLVDEQSGEARFTDFSEERMEKLYEDFIIEFYRREQDHYQGQPPRTHDRMGRRRDAGPPALKNPADGSGRHPRRTGSADHHGRPSTTGSPWAAVTAGNCTRTTSTSFWPTCGIARPRPNLDQGTRESCSIPW